jgi:hypothetical protein
MEGAHSTTLASPPSLITRFQTRTLEAVFRRKLEHPLTSLVGNPRRILDMMPQLTDEQTIVNRLHATSRALPGLLS